MSKRRPSPAMIVAVIALVLGLGGAAVAADLSKSQVKKIAKKQADKRLKANVNGSHVNLADKATSADSATNAANAANATNAANAANAAAVNGVGIVPISHRSGNVTNAVFATAGELTFRVTCAAGVETITATTTNTASSEISAISNEAGGTDASAAQIRGTLDDSFDDTDTFPVGPDGGDTSERQYHVMYSSDGGQNVVAEFVTEDSVGGSNCTVSGFAFVG